MKKLLFATSVLLLLSVQVMAQKYFDIYQNGNVTTSIATTSVDSVGLTGSTEQDRKVNFYRNGKVTNSYLVSSVDSIKVFRTDEEQLVYLGVVGFNQELYEKPIDVLATSTSDFYTTYVNNLTRKDGTLLYYAVDHALDMLKNASFPTPLTSVNLVTFTDGLDQGSLMMNDNYSTDEQYLSAVNKRINNTKVKGLPVTAYSLGLLGSDVTDYALFQKNLNKLASIPENAFEVSSMGAVRTRLQEICDKIISISNRQTFSLKIPGQSNGTLIRFTFDRNSADNSSLYIEGTFNLSNRSLTNVSYHGIKATSGSFIQGTQDGIFVTFTFTGMQREDGNGLIPKDDIREYYRTSGSSVWQQNSEFTPNNNTQTTITHSGAVIMLVLDCSNSLGSQFSDMKYYAQDFINRVAENTQEFKVDAPKNATATLINDFKIKVSWDAVKHAESYEVYRSSSPSRNFSKVASGITSTSWTDNNPLSGNNYYYICAVGHGLTSSASNVTDMVKISLSAPTNVSASLTSNMEVKISWNAVNHAEYYIVYRNSTEDGTYSKVSPNITTTSWTDTEPLDGMNYYLVAAYGHGLEAYDWETVVSVDCKLEAPKNVKATILDNEFVIKVSWDAVKYAESYDVYRKGSSGSFSKAASGITTTNWIDKSPLSGYNYYRVYASGHGHISAGSEVTDAVNYALLAPTNVKAFIPDDEFVIKVTWDAVKYAEYYEVYRSSSSSGSFAKVASSVSSTSWTDSNPLSGKNYYYVRAVGHGVTSTASRTTDAVDYTINAPTSVKAFIPDDNFVIRVTWNAVKHAESYDIYRSTLSSGTFTKVASGITSAYWTDTTPLYGENYYYVRAVGHGLTSNASNTTDVVNYVLSAPTNVNATYNSSTQKVTVTWNSVNGANSYNVYRNGDLIVSNISNLKYIDNNSAEGQHYYCIQAVRGDNISETSAPSFILIPLTNTTITINGINIKMVKVQGGTFQMGGETYATSPIHQVSLTDYYISETEVTQELWKAVMGVNPSYNTSSNQNPVDCLSYYDCKNFIQKLNELTGKHFRLPTEAQWEFAARGGTKSKGYKYSGSNNIEDVAWYFGSGGYHNVGSKKPNELGLYDMSGNVKEYCEDYYAAYGNEAQTNPMGPIRETSSRVLRGGMWTSGQSECTVSYREKTEMHYYNHGNYTGCGLRLAL